MNPRSALTFAAESRVSRLLLKRSSERGAILSYHGVVPWRPADEPLHIGLGELEQQLTLLKEMGYAFIPLAEMVQRVVSGRSVRGCVAVTFDDAYHGVLDAVPILKRQDAPATLFVPTAFIGQNRRFWWDRVYALATETSPDERRNIVSALLGRPVERGLEFWALRNHIMHPSAGRVSAAIERAMDSHPSAMTTPEEYRPMSWPEVSQWAAWDGATVAPHTETHPVLPRLSSADQQREIANSHAILGERIPGALPIIAYPYGLYDAETVRVARASGMQAGVTMDRFGVSSPSEQMRLPRLPFGALTRVPRTPLFLTGGAAWYRQRQMPGGYPALPTEESVAPPP